MYPNSLSTVRFIDSALSLATSRRLSVTVRLLA
jgi:hypothetical protein